MIGHFRQMFHCHDCCLCFGNPNPAGEPENAWMPQRLDPVRRIGKLSIGSFDWRIFGVTVGQDGSFGRRAERLGIG